MDDSSTGMGTQYFEQKSEVSSDCSFTLESHPMQLATWNINGLRSRLDYIAHWLHTRKPSLVGLQELKMKDEQFPHQIFQDLGYFSAAHGQKGWNGVAVLSRKPFEVLQRGLPGQESLGSRLITVRTEDLVFTTVYCPNGKTLEHEDFSKKLSWFDSLLTYLETRHTPDEHFVICGDFNLCPNALDSWNEDRLAGSIFHTDQERIRFQRISDWGLRDLYRERNPKAREFSWWDYRGGAFHKKQGLRIDFLMGTAAVCERLDNALIDREYRKKQGGLTASDHAPVVAELHEGRTDS